MAEILALPRAASDEIDLFRAAHGWALAKPAESSATPSDGGGEDDEVRKERRFELIATKIDFGLISARDVSEAVVPLGVLKDSQLVQVFKAHAIAAQDASALRQRRGVEDLHPPPLHAVDSSEKPPAAPTSNPPPVEAAETPQATSLLTPPPSSEAPVKEGGAFSVYLRALHDNASGISLSHFNLSAADADVLAPALMRFKCLKELDLSNCNITDTILRDIASSLGGGHPLAGLSLKRNHLTAAATPSITALISLHLLEKICLSENPLGDEAVEKIARALTSAPKLRLVSVRSTGASDAGVRALVALAMRQRGGVVLKLGGNPVDAKALVLVAAAKRQGVQIVL